VTADMTNSRRQVRLVPQSGTSATLPNEAMSPQQNILVSDLVQLNVNQNNKY